MRRATGLALMAAALGLPAAGPAAAQPVRRPPADPVAALKAELAREQKAAAAALRRLTPEAVQGQINQALAASIVDELKAGTLAPDPKSGALDLRRTRMAAGLLAWATAFAQGDQKTAAVDEFSFHPQTGELVVKVRVRHRQVWDRRIPGAGVAELYGVTQTARVRYNFGTGAGQVDLNPGSLGAYSSTRPAGKLAPGGLAAATDVLAARLPPKGPPLPVDPPGPVPPRPGDPDPEPAETFAATFTNETTEPVVFAVGGGPDATLEPGQTAAYRLALTADLQPAVVVRQPDGGSRAFAIEPNGAYEFVAVDGAVKNFLRREK